MSPLPGPAVTTNNPTINRELKRGSASQSAPAGVNSSPLAHRKLPQSEGTGRGEGRAGGGDKPGRDGKKQDTVRS